MPRFIPTDVVSQYSAISALNSNFDSLATLIDLCLFRDGTGANAMLSDLDMNHFSIRNIGAPVEPTDVARLQDIQDIIAVNGNALDLLDDNTGATLIGTIAAGAGAVARTLQAKLRDFISIKDFGAVGNGAADDTAAVAANPGRAFFPAGTYDVTTASTALSSVSWGHGQIRDAANNLRGPWFAPMSVAPSRGDWDSVETAFNGDLSRVFIPMERRLTGAVLGTPSTLYQHNPETASIAAYVYNESGHNEANDSNDGRTCGHFGYISLYNTGQGDLAGFTIQGYVEGGNPGATTFLANPAVTQINGTLVAGDHGVYLNPFECSLECDDKDAAAVGYVANIDRNTGDTGPGLGAYACGFRAQSTGTYAVDSMLSGSGSFKTSLDVTPVTFTVDKAAIVLKQNDRIYGNGSSSDGFKATSYGLDFLERSSSGFWNFVYNNTSALQISDQKVNMIKPPQLPVVVTSALPTASASNKGMEYYVSDANSTTRHATVVGGSTNFVKVFSDGTNWKIA